MLRLVTAVRTSGHPRAAEFGWAKFTARVDDVMESLVNRAGL